MEDTLYVQYRPITQVREGNHKGNNHKLIIQLDVVQVTTRLFNDSINSVCAESSLYGL